MRKKGYTLIEVILGIALVGLIAVTFMPMITFGVVNTFAATKFTDVLYDYQEKIEGQIDAKRSETPDGTTSRVIFGNTVKGHSIHVDDDSSAEIYMFLPKETGSEPIPVIQSPPEIEVRNNSNSLVNTDTINILDTNRKLFVKEINITPATRDFYLMSVYRWYMSPEMNSSQTPGDNPNEYFIIKEWNEAKKQLSYADSSNLKFIPNIKSAYNTMILSDIQDSFSLNDEAFIKSFGNRYIRYGVTPFSLRGRIGREEMSNAIYIEAPRIVLLNAVFGGGNRVILTFEDDINEVIDTDYLILNESLEKPAAAYRDDSNYKKLILEFDNLDDSTDIGGNKLLRGAVKINPHGIVSILHNDVFDGEFTIYKVPPVPVTGVSIAGGDMTVELGYSGQLFTNVNPTDATDKRINWTSSDVGVVQVDEDGFITALYYGTSTIRATSVFNSTIFDEIVITVSSEAIVRQELRDVLDALSGLTVNNPGSTSPTIVVPNESDYDEIVFTLTATSDTNRITINTPGRKYATVNRRSSNDSTCTITLTATKGTYSETVTFPVDIPSRNSGGDVTVTKIRQELREALDALSGLTVNNPGSINPTIEVPNESDYDQIVFTLTATSDTSRITIDTPGRKYATVSRRQNNNSTCTITLTATKGTYSEIATFTVNIPSRNSGNNVTVTK